MVRYFFFYFFFVVVVVVVVVVVADFTPYNTFFYDLSILIKIASTIITYCIYAHFWKYDTEWLNSIINLGVTI